MRLFAILLLTLLTFSAHARGKDKETVVCTGAGHVAADFRRGLVSLDGSAFQMKKERLGKRTVRLVGHNMVLVRSPGRIVLVRNGGSRQLNCTPAEVDIEFAAPRAFQKNVVVAPAADTLDDGDLNSHGNSKGAKGGGRGRGGGRGGGGGGKGGGRGK